jgi:hypothetical protein
VNILIKATCHCGAVSIAIPSQPEAVTNCNCSVCRRYGALWAYYPAEEVEVKANDAALQEYTRGSRSIAFVRCGNCGCVTHWRPLPGKRKSSRMGVNVRMFEPEALGRFKIKLLDGALTEDFVGEWEPPASDA